ncbi:MAG TPA: carboxypeptidase-like regulatory domain-containing protein, partial [Gemmataceae bacterium]
LDPDGKPVRGAKLLLIWWGEKLPNKIWATSGAEGRFRFAVRRPPVVNSGWEEPGEPTLDVMAAAEGYGFAVTRLVKPEAAANLTLRLVKDDVPIRGRVLNLEGKPVAGVRVGISDCQPNGMPPLFVSKKGDLTAWLAALQANKNDADALDAPYLTGLYSPAFDLLFPPVVTGADGRFEMKGIGRERVAFLRIEGPTISTQEVRAMTRAREAIRLPGQKDFPKRETVTYHAAAFEILAAPTRPIVGVVRDKDTGKPLAGVTIEKNCLGANGMGGISIRTTSDKAGRYRLVGLPKGEGNKIAATTNELPYVTAIHQIENTPGLEPIAVDFALRRGVWVKGRVTDKTTGKPLGAGVEYFCFQDNPNAKEIDGFGNYYNHCGTHADGSFRMLVLPGHGLIAVRAYNKRYVTGAGADRIKGPRSRRETDLFGTTPYLCHAKNFHALVEIDPNPGDESIACDVTLEPGRTRTGTVLGPDGKPLAGAQADSVGVDGSGFTVEGLKPDERRLIRFVHEDKKLSSYLIVRGDENGPLQARLKRWGTLTGRLVTPLGDPLTGVFVLCSPEVKQNGQTLRPPSLSSHPGKDGRFRIEGLTAGVKYELYVANKGNIGLDIVDGNSKDLTIESGETKDLGDLQVKPME